jgi:hypothetical protein
VDVFSLAAEMLGGIRLTPGQLSHLQAINTRHQLRVSDLLRGTERGDPERPLSHQEEAALHAQLVSDLREILTREQLDAVDGKLRRG